MNKEEIIQIMFGISSNDIETFQALLRTECRKYNNCEECGRNKHNIDCPSFWTSLLDENEWKDCNVRFTILKNVYSIAYNRGYVEGERKTVEYYNELESEGKEDE